MSDPKTVAAYDDKAEDYAQLVAKDAEHPTLIAFLDRLAPDSLILDLGCGPGHAAAVMRDRGFRVDAIDASPEMVRLANATNNVSARVGDFPCRRR